MQNADRAVVKSTSNRCTTQKQASSSSSTMGLGVSTSSLSSSPTASVSVSRAEGNAALSQSSGSSTDSDRVGRHVSQEMDDYLSDVSDVENSDAEDKIKKMQVQAYNSKVFDVNCSAATALLSRKAKDGTKLKEILEAAGLGNLSTVRDMGDPELLNRLTVQVTNCLDEAVEQLDRMKNEHSDEEIVENARHDGILKKRSNSSSDLESIRLLLKHTSNLQENNDSTDTGDSLMCLAAAAGSAELCECLLEMGADVDDRGTKGECTPLMEAANAGNIELIRMLCDNGADVNAKTPSGNSPLHYAAAAGNDGAVMVLIEYGAELEEHNENGHTPLMEAASQGHVNAAAILLSSGAGVDKCSTEFKETALTLASYKGQVAMVDFLLKNGANNEHKTDEMHTALMEAAMDGHIEVAKLLLKSGVQVNMPPDSFESPLTLAACGGHVEMAELLISHGANLEEANDEGYTPIMEAAREGHLPMVTLLHAHGANMEVRTEQETLLTLACRGGYDDPVECLIKSGVDFDMASCPPSEKKRPTKPEVAELVRFLLNNGAKVNAKTNTGETAFTYACTNGNVQVAEVLLAFGAELEHVTQVCHTALMKAARAGHFSMVQFLISQGADVNRGNQENTLTVLSGACANGHIDVVELLLKNGANPTHKLKDGSTMIIEAAKGGHTNIVDLLFNWSNALSQYQPNMDGNETAHSSPSQSSIDSSSANFIANQTSRVPIQGLGTIVPPPHPSPTNISCRSLDEGIHVEQLYGSGDALQLSCCQQHGGTFCREMYISNDRKGQFQHSPTESQSGSEVDDADIDQDDDEVDDRELRTSCSAPNDNLDLSDSVNSRSKGDGAFRQRHLLDCEQLKHKADQLESLIYSKKQCLNRKMRRLSGSTAGISSNGADRDLALGGPPHYTQLQQPQNGYTLMSGDQKFDRKRQRYQGKDQGILAICECFGAVQVNQKGSKKSGKAVSAEDLLVDKKSHFEKNNLKKNNHHVTPDGMVGAAGNLSDWAGSRQEQLQKALEGQDAARADCQQQHHMNSKFFAKAQRKLFNVDQPHQLQSNHPAATSNGTGDGADLNQSTQLPPPNQHPDAQVFQQMTLNGSNQISLQQNQPTSSNCMPPFHDSHNLGQSVPAANFPDQCMPHQYRHLQQALHEAGHPFTDIPPPPCQFQQSGDALTSCYIPVLSGQTTSLQFSVESNQSMLTTKTIQMISRPGLHLQDLGTQSLEVCSSFDAIHPLSPTESPAPPLSFGPVIEVDAQTEDDHETALTLACAGGHSDLANLLLSKGANIEHRDKKSFTPLMHAASSGHLVCVELLLNAGATIDAETDKTKDTALSIACANGRAEVVEFLLKRGAQREHRNVSDYTPLSQAASGGFIEIIKILLKYGAEINSRTGSKLGISPLMLAAMNGHTASVCLLLDLGSDINAQIETNRNTALTLACFQGRHEVVTILADRKANLEHRAKTGLTPLMEAANGGYVEVGKILLDKGADVSAAPMPASRDTPLTIAADKGHSRFVELLLSRHAPIDIKNKKGATALWLACNGGHLDVVELLVEAGADVDSVDNRKVSCLVAAFRKGHMKVVDWLVQHVGQFPSDQECIRVINAITDPELVEKCQQCNDVIQDAKKMQADEATKNANLLLHELQQEKSHMEKKRAAKEKKREKRRQKKNKDKTVSTTKMEDQMEEDGDGNSKGGSDQEFEDSSVDVSSQQTKESSDDAGEKENIGTSKQDLKINKKNKKKLTADEEKDCSKETKQSSCKVIMASASRPASDVKVKASSNANSLPLQESSGLQNYSCSPGDTGSRKEQTKPKSTAFPISSIGDLDDFGMLPSSPVVPLASAAVAGQQRNKQENKVAREPANTVAVKDSKTSKTAATTPKSAAKTGSTSSAGSRAVANGTASTNGKKTGVVKKEEVAKDMSKKMKKIDVPARAVSRVIGRAGCNINAIREHSGAKIDLDKLKASDDAIVTIRGVGESVNQAAELISGLIRETDKDIDQLIAILKQQPPGTYNSMISEAVPLTNAWKNPAKGASGASVVRDGIPSNVWDNRAPKSLLSSVPDTSKLAGNVWTKPAKEVSSRQPVLNSGASNVWDNSMADGIGTLASPSSANVNKHSTGSGSESTDVKPEPIRSFPIGAWKPVKQGSANDRTTYIQPPSTSHLVNDVQPNSNSGVPVNDGKSSLVSKSSIGMTSVQQTVNLCEPTLGHQLQPKSEVSTPTMSSQYLAATAGYSQQVVTSNDANVIHAEYSPFSTNMFSSITESVIPKKPTNGSDDRSNFSGTQLSSSFLMDERAGSSTSEDASADVFLQAKAPGYRPPSQIHRPSPPPQQQQQQQQQPQQFAIPTSYTSQSQLSDGDFQLVSNNMADNGNLHEAMFNNDQQTEHRTADSVHSSFPATPSKMPFQMEPSSMHHFPCPPSHVHDEYITCQSPMAGPRVSSTLNPNAPNFSSRPMFFKPYGNEVPYMQQELQRMSLHAYHNMSEASSGNGFPGSSAQSSEDSTSVPNYSSQSIPVSTFMQSSPIARRYSQDETSAASPTKPVLFSVGDGETPKRDDLSMQMLIESRKQQQLRPIGTERKQVNVMGSVQNIGEPWSFSPGAPPPPPHLFRVGSSMPTLEGLSSMQSVDSIRSQHPAMNGFPPTAMFNSPFMQAHPGYIVPNGSGSPSYMGAMAPQHMPPKNHPSMFYPSMNQVRSLIDMDQFGMMPLKLPVEPSPVAVEEAHHQQWNMWTVPGGH